MVKIKPYVSLSLAPLLVSLLVPRKKRIEHPVNKNIWYQHKSKITPTLYRGKQFFPRFQYNFFFLSCTTNYFNWIFVLNTTNVRKIICYLRCTNITVATRLCDFNVGMSILGEKVKRNPKIHSTFLRMSEIPQKTQKFERFQNVIKTSFCMSFWQNWNVNKLNGWEYCWKYSLDLFRCRVEYGIRVDSMRVSITKWSSSGGPRTNLSAHLLPLVWNATKAVRQSRKNFSCFRIITAQKRPELLRSEKLLFED